MRRKKMIFAIALTGVLVLVQILTHEKAQCAYVPAIRYLDKSVPNIGCDDPVLNPLRKAEYPEMIALINQYYEDEQTYQDFVQQYDDIQVYTKLGGFQNTYVAFVTYRMKIKDQYTEVPGLETFRIIRTPTEEKNWKQINSDEVAEYPAEAEATGIGAGYQIKTEPVEGLSDAYIRKLMSHSDVKQLFEATDQAYQEALKQDALLAESLKDLKIAYAK